MADSTIAAESVLLINNWPDGVIPSLINTGPDDGFTGSAHHNVAAAKYHVGTMAKVYNNGTAGTSVHGWSTLMYAQNQTTAIAAAYELCQPALATDIYGVSSTLANALIDDDICMMMATSISAMTIDYYGWFLVGGVCPGDWITALATGDFPTSNLVVIGQATCGAGAGTKAVLEPQTAGELDGPVAWCMTVDVA